MTGEKGARGTAVLEKVGEMEDSLDNELEQELRNSRGLLPEKSHGRRSLVGHSPWGHRSWTRPSDFTFTFHFHALEKEMATAVAAYGI